MYKILIAAVILLCFSMITPPRILAQQACNLRVTCPTDSSMMQECTGIYDDINGTCDISNPEIDCSPCKERDSSSNQQNNTPSSPSPTTVDPSLTTTESHLETTSNKTSNLPSSDEKVLEGFNKLLLPSEINKQIKPKEESAWDSLVSFFGRVFGFQPQAFGMFASRAETQQKAELPSQLKPKAGNLVENIGKSLGENTGIYSADTPKQVQPKANGTTIDYEKLYQQSWYLPGIEPIHSSE